MFPARSVTFAQNAVDLVLPASAAGTTTGIEKVPVAEDALAALDAAAAASTGVTPAVPGAGPGGPAADASGGAIPCRFRETTVLGCVFVPLVGEQGYPE